MSRSTPPAYYAGYANVEDGKYLVPNALYGCLANEICKLVGLFSGLSNTRPFTFLLPL